MISHERRLFYSFTLLGLLRLGNTDSDLDVKLSFPDFPDLDFLDRCVSVSAATPDEEGVSIYIEYICKSLFRLLLGLRFYSFPDSCII